VGDTLSWYMPGADAALEYRTKMGHLTVVNWDGFENVDTVREDVSGNPTRRAFHGWAWCDTGMDKGAGFAGIWQYESTRVIAMAESIGGGTRGFVKTIGSTRGAWSDTCWMHSERGFYTNKAYVGPGSVVPGTVINWYGDLAAIPVGYVLCDGARKFRTLAGDSMQVPDLRERFIVGASSQSSRRAVWMLIRSRDW
jgi:hypothetical protein